MAGSPSPIRYARNGDLSIAYTVDGSGPIDLLFISGFVSHLDIARSSPIAQSFYKRLCSFARVICFDKRGQGLSDPGPYTVEAVTSDALAVLDDVGSERASVFGVSEGGSASTMLAAAHPDRVEAMVQYGTYARMSQAPDYPAGIPLDKLERTWTRVMNDWGGSESLELFAPSLADDADVREWWAQIVRAGASPAVARTLGEMYRQLDVRSLLASISAPTLVLYREGDRLIPPRLSQTVADGIPGARSVELKGDEHLFLAGDQTAMLDEVEEFLTGRMPERTPDRVLATVLFQDIVDSTVHASRLGDSGWRDVLEACQADGLREIVRRGGRLIKSTGDGVLATFNGPTHASRTALAMQERAKKFGLLTRAGIHTGECELMGDDIGGIAVHIASRVEGIAEPGEVLATSTVRDLSIGSGLEFSDRGEHELKGVPGDWRVFSVAEAVPAQV